MDTKVNKKSNFREILNFLSTVVSWTIFVLLLICAAFLVYYFVATQVYLHKGKGYEPNFSLYTVISPSMVPTINVYDVVIDFKVEKPEDIKIDDVITFNSSIPGAHGGTITHRVIAINKDNDGNYFYQTKGDNNLVEDGVNVSFDSVVGKVALKIPKLGKIQSLVATKMGWMMFIFIPALCIVIKSLLRGINSKIGKSNNKFAKFLNRPLLSFKKVKLLTYTPQPNINTNTEISKKPLPDFMDMDDDDDFDIDDLPNLK